MIISSIIRNPTIITDKLSHASEKHHNLHNQYNHQNESIIKQEGKEQPKTKNRKGYRRQKAYKPVPFYILQIGFNKVGTRSLWEFFERNRIHGVHNDGGKLVASMRQNYYNHLPLLSNYSSLGYIFYADFGAFQPLKVDNTTIWFHHVLANQYKDCKFILNLRHVNHFIKSRYMHYSWYYGGFFQSRTNQNDIQIINQWKHNWYDHNCRILNYFQIHSNLSHNLLIFDIENDSSQKLVSFFAKYNVELNASKWAKRGITNQSISMSRRPKKHALQFERWNNITIKYPQLLFDDTYDNLTEYDRIMQYCITKNVSTAVQL